MFPRVLIAATLIGLFSAHPAAWAQQPITFDTDTGLLLFQVKRDKTAQFEAGVSALRQAMSTHNNPVRQQQAKGLKVFRASESRGSVLYVMMLSPATGDYNFEQLHDEVVPNGKAAYRKFLECLADGFNKLTLNADLATARMTTAAPASSVSTSSGRTLSEAFEFEGGLTARVESRIMETNDVWWKFAWKATITNKSTQPRAVIVVVEFQDADGFPVDDTAGDRTTVNPGSEQVLTGYELITANVAARVGKLNLKLRPQ